MVKAILMSAVVNQDETISMPILLSVILPKSSLHYTQICTHHKFTKLRSVWTDDTKIHLAMSADGLRKPGEIVKLKEIKWK